MATNQAEIELEVCCDAMLDAIQSGGIVIDQAGPNQYRQVIPDEKRETGIAINFCPFCGDPKNGDWSPPPTD